MAENKPEPEIEIKLPSGLRRFSGPKELEKFVQSQESHWDWITKTIGGRNNTGSHFFSPFIRVRERVNAWKQDISNTSQLDGVKREVERCLNSNPPLTILSDSAGGRFIDDVRARFGDEIAASAAVAICRFEDRDLRFAKSVDVGAALGAMHLSGWDAEGRAEVFNEKYSQCVELFNELNSSIKANSQSHALEITAQAESANSLIKTQGEKFDELNSELERRRDSAIEEIHKIARDTIARYDEKLKTAVSESTERLDVLERKYKDIMAIGEPASYWKEKRDLHKKASVTFGIAAGLVGLIGVILLYCAASGASAAFLKNPERDSWAFIAAKLPMAIVAVAVFWLLRILVRTLLSHMHLHLDAEERVVLAKTYLALQAQNPNLGDKDREIVLEQLLRHAPSGINKDDSAPQLTISKL